LAAIFFEDVLEVVAFFLLRARSGSGWILFDGIIALLLAFLIWYSWPSNSVGILVGINLFVSGFSRLMYSMAARKAPKAVA
jgi:uncharacterized membrane protein HdeD (DUF308 family)